jgi:type VI secretion system protein ImpL
MWQSIAGVFNSAFTTQGMMILYGVMAAVLAGVAWMWAKHPVRWIMALVTVGVLLAAYCYRDLIPGREDLDPDLPSAFLPPRFVWWVLLLALSAIYLSVHLVGVWVQSQRGVEGEGSGEPARFPDLQSAWDEIQIRLSHAHYDAGQQKVFLMLSPEESIAAAMIRSAGLQLFAQAPADENAPIHAYATSEGLFISCAGASAWGRGEEGTERLVDVCRRVRELNPEQPVLRGVAVLYPMEKAASPEMLQGVGSLRNDLQTIRAELSVRCPTLSVFCLRDSYGGFGEFIARIPTNVRVRRCGFSIPPSQRFDRASALRGLGWLVQWFYTWSLKLMTDQFHDTAGNSNLVAMNAQLWRDLPTLCHLVDVSFSTHARAEPILVRGCYFVAGGPAAEDRAFAAGLINGKSSKMIADAAYTSWSAGAEAIDRRYRRAALGLALGAALIALPIWYWQIIGRLRSDDVSKAHPASLWIALGCLGLLAAVWAVGISSFWLRGSRSAKPARGT